jgi:AraC family transcriptional regulator
VDSEYSDRINRVLSVIDASLDRKLGLEELAAIGAFSPYHFHRIFSAALGETLHAYILRKRLQRAAGMLAHRSDLDVTRIALDCGFSTPSDFSRAFRRSFGTSPKSYRARGSVRLDSAGMKAEGGSGTERPERAEVNPEQSRLRDLRLAYITCIGISMRMDTPKILRAFGRLHRWGASLGLPESELRFLGLVYDEPEIAPIDKIRYCAAIELPKGTAAPEKRPSGIDVSDFRLAGPCLRLSFDRSTPGFPRDYLSSIDALFKDWMPARSLAPDDRPIVEAYSAGPAGNTLVAVNVPIRHI